MSGKDLADYEQIEVFRFPWSKKKLSIESTSSWASSRRPSRKQSLYDRISRKLSIFDVKGDKHRRSSHQGGRKISLCQNSIRTKQYLNTINENQNSPQSSKTSWDFMRDFQNNNNNNLNIDINQDFERKKEQKRLAFLAHDDNILDKFF